MTLHKKVYNAVHQSVENHNQSPKVAFKIINWLEKISEGNANFDDKKDVKEMLKKNMS
ncbi:MAG TPA: hypothetical protein V6D15_25315 [Oculatellaceae cyanobacterium]|jgi:hypothetical protein